MDFQLIVVRGRSASDALSLIDGVNTVGRHDDCQIRIKSSQVSRRHCELFEKKGLLMVKDLGSSNGTLVNGKRIEGQSVLEPGDELTIGGVKLRVAKVGEALPAPKVPSKAANDTAVVEAIVLEDEPPALARRRAENPLFGLERAQRLEIVAHDVGERDVTGGRDQIGEKRDRVLSRPDHRNVEERRMPRG